MIIRINKRERYLYEQRKYKYPTLPAINGGGGECNTRWIEILDWDDEIRIISIPSHWLEKITGFLLVICSGIMDEIVQTMFIPASFMINSNRNYVLAFTNPNTIQSSFDAYNSVIAMSSVEYEGMDYPEVEICFNNFNHENAGMANAKLFVSPEYLDLKESQ